MSSVDILPTDDLPSIFLQATQLCPCDSSPPSRSLETTSSSLWEIIYISLILLLMFLALISDKAGADMVMISALTLCMASGIITVEEGLAGFSNEGILTVLALFVVAAGIGHTGALDWYMGKLLGRPNTLKAAQMRLMVPIAIVSAFLNNTPVVAVMIPIVQRWSTNVGLSVQQLLIPLSYASILGGTCTLIGTSTNLVVLGLMQARYPDEPAMGLFDLGEYGVPIAVAGAIYILVMSPFLLPGGRRVSGVVESEDGVLLGARLTKWSLAAGRSVKRSGLRDTGGIFLVSVQRAATGNVHRAVGQDFVLNVGDILYFTGLAEGFGEFCEEHGLEVITNEIEESLSEMQLEEDQDLGDAVEEQDVAVSNPIGFEKVGTTKRSLSMSDDDEKIRCINKMRDLIRGFAPAGIDDDPIPLTVTGTKSVHFSASTKAAPISPPQIVVVSEGREPQHIVVIGVDAPDRPGLLLDISKALLRLNLTLHHSEATVLEERSLSVWRCEPLENGVFDAEEIWSVLSALLENESGVQAIKSRGLRVIRASVTDHSRLVGKTANEANFRQTYKAAIVAIQKADGKAPSSQLSNVRLGPGDVLILQANDDSPLLLRPPPNFYTVARSRSVQSFVSRIVKTFSQTDLTEGDSEHREMSRPSSGHSLVSMVRKTISSTDLASAGSHHGEKRRRSDKAVDMDSNSEYGQFQAVDEETGVQEPEKNNGIPTENPIDAETQQVWEDLRVKFLDNEKPNTEQGISREFLTAMEIAPQSKLATKSAQQLGLNKLPGVLLVSIERPISTTATEKPHVMVVNLPKEDSRESRLGEVFDAEPLSVPVPHDDPLKEGDILWFSGSATAVGDLRKIPGLKSYESDEVMKIEEKIHERRLVQAVVARTGPLVGKTVKDVKFRTRYGAAVIAIHREGKRVHEHPGKVKLHAGDVLLLEAGPTFIERNSNSDRSFVLLSEVKDSAPPRLKLLVPALALMVAMLAVYTAGLVSLFVAAVIASMVMVFLGILSQQEVRDAVNWEVYVTIASAFGIGTALTNSGVAAGVANFLVDIGTAVGIGYAGLYGAVYLATFLISNVVTNNAAAALIFPIAMDAADQTGADRTLMSYDLMLAASASFMTPFGYTTNLMIYGPGKYKTMDFLRMGTPLQLVLWILTVALLSTPPHIPWYLSWIVTFAALVVIVLLNIIVKRLNLCSNEAA